MVSPLVGTLKDFYMTDVISRASKTMAEVPGAVGAREEEGAGWTVCDRIMLIL